MVSLRFVDYSECLGKMDSAVVRLVPAALTVGPIQQKTADHVSKQSQSSDEQESTVKVVGLRWMMWYLCAKLKAEE